MRISEQGGARSPEAKRSEESIVVSKAPEDWPTSRRCRVLERAAPCARSWSAPVLRRFGADNFGARRLVLLVLALGPILTQGSSAQINPAPYPPSPFFQSIT